MDATRTSDTFSEPHGSGQVSDQLCVQTNRIYYNVRAIRAMCVSEYLRSTILCVSQTCWSEHEIMLHFVVAPNALYWIFSICFGLLYRYGLMAHIQKRTAKHSTADNCRYLALTLFNTLVPPFLTAKFVMRIQGNETYCEPTQGGTGWVLLGRIVVWVCVQDVLYYSVHRLFHTIPWLYTNIHKCHHEVLVPWAWSAEVQHPIDALITNVGTMMVASEVAGLDMTWRSIAVCYMYVRGVMAHVGVFTLLNWTPSLGDTDWGAHHDRHHAYPKCNYGGFGLYYLDHLCGTDYDSVVNRSKNSLH